MIELIQSLTFLPLEEGRTSPFLLPRLIPGAAWPLPLLRPLPLLQPLPSHAGPHGLEAAPWPCKLLQCSGRAGAGEGANHPAVSAPLTPATVSGCRGLAACQMEHFFNFSKKTQRSGLAVLKM